MGRLGPSPALGVAVDTAARHGAQAGGLVGARARGRPASSLCKSKSAPNLCPSEGICVFSNLVSFLKNPIKSTSKSR